MTSGGEIGISLGILGLMAGGSLVFWIWLFRRADRGEGPAVTSEGRSPEAP